MSDTKHLSEVEAIRQVIVEGGAMDYVDVVNVVRKKFGLNVSSALVEQVHVEMCQQQPKRDIQPRIRMEVGVSDPTLESAKRESVEATPKGHLQLAANFVKSVGGLKNAVQALAELEVIMRDLKE